MSGLTKTQGILTGYLFLTFGVVYLYLVAPQFHNFVDTWNEYLESALMFPKFPLLPNFSFLDFVGSLFVCKRYREASKGDKSWFEILLACVLMQFGGTLIIALILGQVPSWILSRAALPGFFLAWWLTFYSPDDIFYNTVSKNNFLLFFLGIFNAVSGGHAVTSWGLDKAYSNAFHTNAENFGKSYFLCILCGTIAACGGGILAEVFNFYSNSKSFTLRHKSAFFEIGNYSVSAGLNRSFWLAMIYYILISDPKEFLPISFSIDKVTGHSIIALLQISAYFMIYHIPQTDIYQEFSNFVLDFLNIPSFYSFEAVDHEKNE